MTTINFEQAKLNIVEAILKCVEQADFKLDSYGKPRGIKNRILKGFGVIETGQIQGIDDLTIEEFIHKAARLHNADILLDIWKELCHYRSEEISKWFDVFNKAITAQLVPAPETPVDGEEPFMDISPEDGIFLSGEIVINDNKALKLMTAWGEAVSPDSNFAVRRGTIGMIIGMMHRYPQLIQEGVIILLGSQWLHRLTEIKRENRITVFMTLIAELDKNGVIEPFLRDGKDPSPIADGLTNEKDIMGRLKKLMGDLTGFVDSISDVNVVSISGNSTVSINQVKGLLNRHPPYQRDMVEAILDTDFVLRMGPCKDHIFGLIAEKKSPEERLDLTIATIINSINLHLMKRIHSATKPAKEEVKMEQTQFIKFTGTRHLTQLSVKIDTLAEAKSAWSDAFSTGGDRDVAKTITKVINVIHHTPADCQIALLESKLPKQLFKSMNGCTPVERGFMLEGYLNTVLGSEEKPKEIKIEVNNSDRDQLTQAYIDRICSAVGAFGLNDCVRLAGQIMKQYGLNVDELHSAVYEHCLANNIKVEQWCNRTHGDVLCTLRKMDHAIGCMRQQQVVNSDQPVAPTQDPLVGIEATTLWSFEYGQNLISVHYDPRKSICYVISESLLNFGNHNPKTIMSPTKCNSALQARALFELLMKPIGNSITKTAEQLFEEIKKVVP